MVITLKSTLTGTLNSMEMPISEQQWHAWNTGNSHIDKCFPDLNFEQKHFILYGTTKEEWENIYGDEESIRSLPKENDCDNSQ